MYSDGLKKVSDIKLYIYIYIYIAFCSLFTFWLSQKEKKGIGQSAAKFCFCCQTNNYLAIKIEKVQRLGSVKYTTHECQNLTIKSLLNLD